MINIKPTGHYVLIELIEVKPVSAGGIILTSVQKEQKATQFAKVLAIGPTAFIGVEGCDPRTYANDHPNSKKDPHQIWGLEIGAIVGFARYEGQDIVASGVERLRVIPDTQLTYTVTGEIEITKADF